MLRHSEFLAFRPSEIAAATLIYAAVNHNKLKLSTFNTRNHEITIWTREVEEATRVRYIEDIKPVYELLQAKIFSLDWN